MRIGIVASAIGLCILATSPAPARAGTASSASLSAGAAIRATAVSGPILDIQPAGFDFGVVNVGTSGSRSYTVRNTGDADLEIAQVLISDPQITTDQPVPTTLGPGASFLATATFTPTGGPLHATLEVRGNATNGAFILPITGLGNHTPVIDPITPLAVIAWVPLQLTVHASDLDDDPILLSASGLPAGALFDDAAGTFSWTPDADAGGEHTVIFTATDGHASSSVAVSITVTVLNHPPVANPGGAYVGIVGMPVTFDGSGSRDPDGQALVFHWAFGDGGTGEGERTVYAYAAAGSYPVTLDVVDDGTPNLHGIASTQALIASETGTNQITLPAIRDNTIYSESDSSFGGGWCLQVGRPTQPRLGQTLIRRAMIQFDLTSIPPGSKIVSARLDLFRPGEGGPGISLRVHRLLQPWGEGNSGAGDQCLPPPRLFGRAATESASTWNYRFYGSRAEWDRPGGSYRSAFSDSEFASTFVQDVHLASRAMTGDAADWVADPASNHGWILLGAEDTLGTGIRFASRQDPFHPPTLTISFTPPTGACCKPDGTCAVTSPSECEAQSGTYGGDNSTCEQLVCLEPYVDWLPLPSIAKPLRGRAGGEALYEITMREFRQKLHRDLPPTTLWGYDGQYPGPTIEARRNQPVHVRWINDLRDVATGLPRTQHYFDVDTRIHGPDMAGKTPRTVVHLHGGHVPPEYDGFPESTFVSGGSRLYKYPNNQLPTTLWYHDHAMGITRYNVMLGLMGFYLIRDKEEEALALPSGAYEIPLAIQDRSFHADGSLSYPDEWMPMFMGDKVLVNGKVWPKLQVDRGKYRFRVLNGSNHRIFTLALSDCRAFQVIGSDGGLLSAPAEVRKLVLGPAERADVVVDFAGDAPGAEVLLEDTTESADPAASRVMKFVVSGRAGWAAPLPVSLTKVERIPERQAGATRTFELRWDPILQEFRFGNQGWDDAPEFPSLGSTEIWQFANETAETHPVHMHLVQFQVLDRSSFQLVDGTVVPGTDRRAPAPDEAGWKDTAKVGPRELLRVIMRFGPDGYLGEYVFHCHMLEHEDNEMMRRFTVVPPGALKPGRAVMAAPKTEQAFTTSLARPRTDGANAILEYTLAEPGPVTLAIFDVAGRRVASLADGVQEAGEHRAALGLRRIARGIYFVRLRAAGKVFTRRMPVL